SIGGHLQEAHFAGAQLDGPLEALVARLGADQIAPGLQDRGWLGLARGPQRGAGFVADVPRDVGEHWDAAGEEAQFERRRLRPQPQLLGLPRPNLNVANGARVDGTEPAYHAVAAAGQREHRRGSARRDHLWRGAVETLDAVGDELLRSRSTAGCLGPQHQA